MHYILARSEYYFQRLTIIVSFVQCADSKFSQQELPACKPLLTPKLVTIPVTNLIFLQTYICSITRDLMRSLNVLTQVVAVFLIIAVLFIPIGLAALLASEKVSKVNVSDH
jgi:hypothetical protein